MTNDPTSEVESSLMAEITLPPEVNDASAWYGSEFVHRTDWIEHLSSIEVEELKNVANAVADPTNITTESSPLPTLGPHLQRLLDEVLNGRGFVLIKGLTMQGWTSVG